MVFDIDAYMEERRAEEEKKHEDFMQKCRDKITDGDVIYRALALFIAKRFDVEIPHYRGVDGSVYHILNYYIENVDEDFETWLNKEDAPMIRPISQLRKIFPEFDFMESEYKILKTVNKVYNLDLDYTEEYIYSLSFDFNSFTPIDVSEIHEIKEEIKTLQKYGYPTDELEEKLNSFELDPEILEAI